MDTVIPVATSTGEVRLGSRRGSVLGIMLVDQRY
jgi:hypothetical protein